MERELDAVVLSDITKNKPNFNIQNLYEQTLAKLKIRVPSGL